MIVGPVAENDCQRGGKSRFILGIGLVLILAAGSVCWRAKLWWRDPAFGDPTTAETVFVTEGALQYRYAKMVAEGRALPEIDRHAQHPEGFAVRRDLALGMEYVEALPYRFFKPDMLFAHYLAWATAIVTSLGIIGCYAAGLLLWKSPWPALGAAALYALHFPSFARTIGNYGREHFALPFLLLGLPLMAGAAQAFETEASRRRGWLLAHAAGICWAIALCTWHVSRFAFMIAIGFFFLASLLWTAGGSGTSDSLRPSQKNLSLALSVTVAWCAIASLLHPMLRARFFMLSPAVLSAAVLAGLSLLPERTPFRRRRLIIVAGVCATGLIGVALTAAGGFSHVSALLMAKLRYGFPPADPLQIPFEARVMWVEAFRSPPLHFILHACTPLLLPAIAGAALLVKGWKEKGGMAWLLYALLVYGAGFALVTRMWMILTFYLALSGGGLLMISQSSRKVAAVALLATCLLLMGYQTYHYRTPNDAFSRFVSRFVSRVAPPAPAPAAAYVITGLAVEEDRVFNWLRLNSQPGDAVVARFGSSPSVLLRAGRPIVLHSKFETRGIREKVKSFFDSVYADEETFYQWCAKHQASYVLLHPELALRSGPESPLYMAGRQTVALESAAYIMHFFPERLHRFELAYENSYLRIYRVLGGEARPQHCKRPIPQPVFDPNFFDATPERRPPVPILGKRLAQLHAGQKALGIAVNLFVAGRAREAFKEARAALELHPGLPMARSLLAELLLRSSQPQKALLVVEDALKLQADVADVWRLYAAVLRANNRPEQAREALRRALELQLDDR